jgi:hypothetical protein
MFKVSRSCTALINLYVVVALFSLTCRTTLIANAVTEDLLLMRGGGGDPGRMWPGFAAGEVDYEGVVVPARTTQMLSPQGIPSLNGGDLTSIANATVAPVPSMPGMQGLGGLAGNMMNNVPGMPGVPGIPGIGGMSGMFGMPGSDLSSLLGMMGATGLLNMLPGIGMLNPQQLLNTAMLAGGLANLLTQFPQFLSQAITGLYQGILGMGGALFQAIVNPFDRGGDGVQASAENGISAAGTDGLTISATQGGVAGSTPSTPAAPNAPQPAPAGGERGLSLGDAAREMIGTSTRDIPGTQNGQVGCAAAACMVFEHATGQQLVPGNSMELQTAVMYQSLRNDPRFVEVGWGNTQPGDLVITGRNPATGRAGHVGYVTTGNRIISNSSDGFAGSAPGTIQNNYSFDGWQRDVTTRNPGQSGIFRYVGGNN